MRATWYGILQEKCRAPEWAQNADAHFVRACAVETHVKISQEPLHTEIYRKNAAPQNEPRTPTHILCEPAQCRNAYQDFTRTTLCGNLQEKCRSEHPDQAPAFTPNYRKNPSVPQCGLTAWGKNVKKSKEWHNPFKHVLQYKINPGHAVGQSIPLDCFGKLNLKKRKLFKREETRRNTPLLILYRPPGL